MHDIEKLQELNRDLAHRVVEGAKDKELTIAVAESLTGGSVAAVIVSVPGASAVFTGGVVSYHPETKVNLLSVSKRLLIEYGAVNKAVASQMALGVREACGVENSAQGVADIGVSTTGVAGPDPDPVTGEAPGTVWVGNSSNSSATAALHTFSGDRQEVREQSVSAALRAILAEIEGF